MATNNTLTFSDGDFDSSVLESQTPVLVDFWAPWCGPCHVMAPTVDSLAGEYEGRIGVGKLNVDENREIAERFGIRSIPTLVPTKNPIRTVRVADRACLGRRPMSCVSISSVKSRRAGTLRTFLQPPSQCARSSGCNRP